MCGIAGMINYTNNPDLNACNDTFINMKKTLARRGPDQDGIYSAEHATLVHTRLAVVDIENGRQPMVIADHGREYAVVYNGELYNTEDIRAVLKSRGYSFKGHSDTEVLLCSYIEWGEECVNWFNGIFAFAVWDKHKDRLFVARDRMGVKPFFYCLINDTFVFGSEIKTLLAYAKIKPRIDIHSIYEIMFIGPGRTPGYGVFQNIKELRPGECGYFSQDGLFTSYYWKLEDKEHPDSFEQTVEKVRFLVEDAINRQLVSDVPICTFLSGGLDSSIISSVAHKYLKEKGEKLHTFSVDYIENDKYFKSNRFQPDDDKKYIDAMREYLNIDHTTVTIGISELVDALLAAVDARDLPGMADVDSSLLLFCEEVKKHATVALSGECADEIFGGYPWYRDEKIRNIDGFPWAQSTQFRSSFLKEEFINEITPSEYVYARYNNTVQNTDSAYAPSGLEKRMKEMMHLNIAWFMQTLLDRKDRMSMYSGLEVRVPFCDHRITEYLYSVPWEFKNYQNREKGLLRKAMEGLLPDSVLWRKKNPYPKTFHPLYLQAVSDLLTEIINNPSSPLLQIAKKSELEKLLSSDNPVPWYGQLMTTPQTIAYFIQIDYWLKKYKIEIV